MPILGFPSFTSFSAKTFVICNNFMGWDHWRNNDIILAYITYDERSEQKSYLEIHKVDFIIVNFYEHFSNEDIR